MARKKDEPPKPFYPTRHEFVASLDRFAHEAGMLADAVRTALSIDKGMSEPVAKILRERLAAFRLAQFGDTADDE